MIPRIYSNRYRRQPKRQPKAKAMNSWSGWGLFFGELVIAYGFLLFGLTHFAFATRDARESNRAPGMQMVRSSVTVVKGTISWKDGVGRIADDYTGRSFALSNADGVKALWDSGVKEVALEGHITDTNTFSVEKVSMQ